MRSLVIKPGHVQPVWSGHPWVYAQAVQRVEGGVLPGDEVDVLDPKGNFLGRGFYSPGSAIPVRIATRNPDQRLNARWLRETLARAGQLRRELGFPSSSTTGFRLVHGEGDGLPGLVVDRFDKVGVVQLPTIGWHRRREMLFSALEEVFGFEAIVDRTPDTHAKAEGFEPQPGVVRGTMQDETLRFKERSVRYEIPLSLQQKTGFYFDQRPLRGRIEQLAKSRRVLDAYCYVGSISVAAAKGGAKEVVAIDDSGPALTVAALTASLNDVQDRITFERGKAMSRLVAFASAARRFDLVVLDPPSLAPSRRAAERALKGFRRIVGAGCRVIRPGGLLVVSACSAAIGLEALTRAVALGALDARMEATVIERWFQGLDHPVPAAFQEGLYLKTIIARIDRRR